MKTKVRKYRAQSKKIWFEYHEATLDKLIAKIEKAIKNKDPYERSTFIQIHKQTGVGVATIIRLFHRKTKDPKTSTLIRLCRGLGIKIDIKE